MVRVWVRSRNDSFGLSLSLTHNQLGWGVELRKPGYSVGPLSVRRDLFTPELKLGASAEHDPLARVVLHGGGVTERQMRVTDCAIGYWFVHFPSKVASSAVKVDFNHVPDLGTASEHTVKNIVVGRVAMEQF